MLFMLVTLVVEVKVAVEIGVENMPAILVTLEVFMVNRVQLKAFNIDWLIEVRTYNIFSWTWVEVG